jgi:atypical dual specificity phosphatase
MLKKLIARAVYYPTLGFNILLGRWLKVRNWWDRVDTHCILGAVPLGSDPDRLKELGVTGVINMALPAAGDRAIVVAYNRLPSSIQADGKSRSRVP